MKTEVLRNIYSPQLNLALAQDYALFLAPPSDHLDDQENFERIRSLGFSALSTASPQEILDVIQDKSNILGCLVDQRTDFEPRLFLTHDTFALIQDDKRNTVMCSPPVVSDWVSYALPKTTLRVIGGSQSWLNELKIHAFEDILSTAEDDEDLQKLLFEISQERHFLGFEDPTPFLFGVGELTKTYLA